MKITQILEIWDGPNRKVNRLGNHWGKDGTGSARGDDGYGGWLPDEGDFYMDDNRFDWVQPGRMVNFELPDGAYTGKIVARETDGVKVNFFRGDDYRSITFKNPKNLSLVRTSDLVKDQGTKEFNEKLAKLRGPEPMNIQSEYTPIRVGFKQKDEFKQLARGICKWDGDKKTWLIKSEALTPSLIQQLKNIGVVI